MNNLGIIIALVVILGGAYFFVSQNGDSADTQTVETTTVVESEGEDVMEDKMEDKEDEMSDKEEMDDKDTMEDKEESASDQTGETVSTVNARGSFEAYSESKVANADGTVVLGFFADWCPSCRALKGDLEASSADIPGNLTILDVDYDNSTELKKKYGVTTQHTLVEVDANGNLVQKWSGGNTLESVLKKVS